MGRDFASQILFGSPPLKQPAEFGQQSPGAQHGSSLKSLSINPVILLQRRVSSSNAFTPVLVME
jgi:hypothetical protein